MKAVIYARFSSEKQNEASIEGQLRECMEYANFNGIEVIGNYIDRAQSAKTDHRPEFQRMIKDSYKRPFDCILVWKLDRFARNRYDSAYYKNILKKNGVRVTATIPPITRTFSKRTACALSPQRKAFRRVRTVSCWRLSSKAMPNSIRRSFPKRSSAA